MELEDIELLVADWLFKFKEFLESRRIDEGNIRHVLGEKAELK